MRISTLLLGHTLSSSLGAATERLFKLQEQAASGLRINRPSDDPAGAAQTASIRSTQSELTGYQNAITMGQSLLNVTDGALDDIINHIRNARSAGLSGATATASVDDRIIFANQVDGDLRALVDAANTEHAGAYLFGGLKTQTAPFALSSAHQPVVYNGDNGNRFFQVGRSVAVAVNLTGSRVFNMGGVADASVPDAFSTLAELRDALAANDVSTIQSCIDDINRHLARLTSLRGEIGVRGQSLELSSNRLSAIQLALKDTLSTTEDTDLTQILVELQSQQNAYQAAINTATLISQPGLWNVLH